jgi:hypothetical protein
VLAIPAFRDIRGNTGDTSQSRDRPIRLAHASPLHSGVFVVILSEVFNSFAALHGQAAAPERAKPGSAVGRWAECEPVV